MPVQNTAPIFLVENADWKKKLNKSVEVDLMKWLYINMAVLMKLSH